MRWYLGSASRARQAILASLWPEAEIVLCPSHVAEDVGAPGADVEDYCRRVTRLKTEAVLAKLAREQVEFAHGDLLVCGDCVISSANGDVRGKPSTEAEANAWLDDFSHAGRFDVVQAIELTDLVTRRSVAKTATTRCLIEPIPHQGRQEYLSDSGAMGAAGAVIVEHPFFKPLIKRFENGTEQAVMGLCPNLLSRALADLRSN